MLTYLHWISGPWPGKLAVSARPRGGDWLEDEIAAWRKAGVGVVASLLTANEEQYLDLRNEALEVGRQGLAFISFPIPDRQVPPSPSAVAPMLERVAAALNSGTSVVIHCRQGIGRSGLVAACLLVSQGLSAGAAVDAVSSARGFPIPETDEQRRWIDQYAASLAGTK